MALQILVAQKEKKKQNPKQALLFCTAFLIKSDAGEHFATRQGTHTSGWRGDRHYFWC